MAGGGQYDNRNRGVLFKNDRRENDRQPLLRGYWTGPDGVELELAAWKKTGRNGDFLALSAKPKRERPGGSAGFGGEPADEDAPF